MDRDKAIFEDVNGESHQVTFVGANDRTLRQYKMTTERRPPGGLYDFLRLHAMSIEPAVDPTLAAAELLEAHEAKIDNFESLDDAPVQLIQPASDAMMQKLKAR